MPPRRSSSVGRLSRLPPNAIRAIPITRRTPSPTSRAPRPAAQTTSETICPDFGESIVLSKRSFKSFSRLVIPPNIKTLVITHNMISDFVGFSPPSSLENLDVSDNPIASLRGFPAFCALKNFDCKNTPLARNQFFRIALILVIGKSLRSINGDKITANERRLAKSYLPECLMLLRAGWQITYPGPSKDEVTRIKAKMAEEVKNEAASSINNNSFRNTQPSPVILKRKVRPQSKIYEDSLKKQEKEIEELNREIEKLESQNASRNQNN